MGLGHVALLLPWVALAVGSRKPVTDNSFLWHIRAGSVQLSSGRVLTEDPFSYTMQGEPWRTQSWLAELLYARLESWFGLDFVDPMMLIVAAVFLSVLGVFGFSVAKKPAIVALFLALTAVLIVAFWNPRPVVFSFVLFSLLLVVEKDEGLRWSMPLIIWVWAASHGSFVIGCGFLLLRAWQRRDPAWWRHAAAAGVVSLATAHGWGVVNMLLEFFTNRDALGVIREWGHPDFLTPPLFPVLVAVLALIVAAGAGRIQRRDGLLLVPFFLLAFSANRSVPPAWLGLAPLTLLGLATVRYEPSPPTHGQQRVNVVLAAALVMVPLLLPRPTGLDEERFPLVAADALTDQRVFHSDGAGGYLIYAQWPDRLVYIDDRAELYGDRLERFIEIRGLVPDWRSMLEADAPSQALLPPEQPIVEALERDGWQRTHEDDHWVVLSAPDRAG